MHVLNRGTLVARLVSPTAVTDCTALRQRLIASGVLRAGSGTSGALLKTPPLRVDANIGGALHAERD